LNEHEECGLKRVLNVLLVTQDGAARPPNHHAMSSHQGFEGGFGRLAVARGKPLEQLTVGKVARPASVDERAKLSWPKSPAVSRHEFHPPMLREIPGLPSVWTLKQTPERPFMYIESAGRVDLFQFFGAQRVLARLRRACRRAPDRRGTTNPLWEARPFAGGCVPGQFRRLPQSLRSPRDNVWEPNDGTPKTFLGDGLVMSKKFAGGGEALTPK
jgi:hypothetical protein